jgi:hypothetical protein
LFGGTSTTAASAAAPPEHNAGSAGVAARVANHSGMRKTPLALPAATLVVSVTAIGTSAAPPSRFRPAVTIGTAGNEPLIRSAPDGTLYVSALQHLYVSRDGGRHWTQSAGSPYSTTLNGNSDTTTGTSTFVAIGAGKAGHIGLIFYRANVAGNPDSLPATTRWDAVYAESTDALSAHPHWTLTTVEKNVHSGIICATTGCTGNGRFAGDFLDTSFDAKDRPQIVWVRDNGSATEIRYTTAR